MAARTMEQHLLFLPYQIEVLSDIISLELTTLSQPAPPPPPPPPPPPSLAKKVQNEVMRVILGMTNDKAIQAMQHQLDLLSVKTEHKGEQGEAYLTAMQNPNSPLHDAVKL